MINCECEFGGNFLVFKKINAPLNFEFMVAIKQR
jgi:hypothetical protein